MLVHQQNQEDTLNEIKVILTELGEVLCEKLDKISGTPSEAKDEKETVPEEKQTKKVR